MAKINEKTVALETFLREKIRETIVEEMMTLTEWDPREWDESPEDFLPDHGESRFSPEEGELRWSGPERKWMDAHSWDSMYGERPGLVDPEDDMDPEDKKRMMDSLLSMEFDENKQIHMEHINKMIKEHVRKYLKGAK